MKSPTAPQDSSTRSTDRALSQSSKQPGNQPGNQSTSRRHAGPAGSTNRQAATSPTRLRAVGGRPAAEEPRQGSLDLPDIHEIIREVLSPDTDSSPAAPQPAAPRTDVSSRITSMPATGSKARDPQAQDLAVKNPQLKDRQSKDSQPKDPQLKDPKAQLLEHPALWQARRLRPETEIHSTGYEPLDQAIGGWPKAGLLELHHEVAGIGELQLLLPLLRQLSETENRWIVWINPPYLPCAPALKAAGVDLNKLLLVHPKTAEEAIWALERSLQSGSSCLTLCWFGHKALPDQSLTPSQSRRLKLAAKQGNALCCLFRNNHALQEASQASLRLALKPAEQDGALNVRVCKRQGGWPGAELTLPLDSPPARRRRQMQSLQEQLILWRHNALNDAQHTPGNNAGEIDTNTRANRDSLRSWAAAQPSESRVMH